MLDDTAIIPPNTLMLTLLHDPPSLSLRVYLVETAYTNPWPAATANQTEYFRVGFDARLKWADGDASKEPRQRGRGAFTGSYSRRPRPPPTPLPVPSSHQDSTAAPGLAANEVTKPGETGAAAASSSLTEAAANRENGADLPLTEAVNPLSTVFCETAVKVQVLLPPPYNTMLPWRLVRALLGRILSTVVAFILPRFLEVRKCFSAGHPTLPYSEIRL